MPLRLRLPSLQRQVLRLQVKPDLPRVGPPADIHRLVRWMSQADPSLVLCRMTVVLGMVVLPMAAKVLCPKAALPHNEGGGIHDGGGSPHDGGMPPNGGDGHYGGAGGDHQPNNPPHTGLHDPPVNHAVPGDHFPDLSEIDKEFRLPNGAIDPRRIVEWATRVAHEYPMITKDGVLGIYNYTTESFEAINPYLRNVDQLSASQESILQAHSIADMTDEQRMLWESKINQADEGGLAALPPYRLDPSDLTSTTWRGMRGTDELLSRMNVGDVFHDPGYYSSTLDRSVAEMFARGAEPGTTPTLVTVIGNDGIHVAPLSRFAYENEVLFPRNSCFEVLSRVMGGTTAYSKKLQLGRFLRDNHALVKSRNCRLASAAHEVGWGGLGHPYARSLHTANYLPKHSLFSWPTDRLETLAVGLLAAGYPVIPLQDGVEIKMPKRGGVVVSVDRSIPPGDGPPRGLHARVDSVWPPGLHRQLARSAHRTDTQPFFGAGSSAGPGPFSASRLSRPAAR